jgi:hypothetical protein
MTLQSVTGLSGLAGCALCILLVSGLAGLSSARADETWVGSGDASGSTDRSRSPIGRQSGSSLDERVAAMAIALDLDGEQRSQLRRVLERQRAQIAGLWNDTTIPAARRIMATQAIGELTADRIRALLNDAQRKRYDAPRHARSAAPNPGDRSMEDWMKAGREPRATSVAP